MKVERRVHPRVDVWLAVTFRSSGELVHNYMSNISKGGMFIQTEETHELGKVLALTFALPGQDHLIRVKGTVVWRALAGSSISPGVGIQFTEMPEEDRHILEGYLAAELGKKKDLNK